MFQTQARRVEITMLNNLPKNILSGDNEARELKYKSAISTI